jgi:hypothetical protein
VADMACRGEQSHLSGRRARAQAHAQCARGADRQARAGLVDAAPAVGGVISRRYVAVRKTCWRG